MGEARRRAAAGNGGADPDRPVQVRVRVVRSIKLEPVPADHVVMLILGDTAPELAAPLSVAEARQLAAALLGHAEALARDAPRIITP